MSWFALALSEVVFAVSDLLLPWAIYFSAVSELLFPWVIYFYRERERRGKHESKSGNPVKAVREGSIIFRFERPTSRKSVKCNRKTRRFWCNHKINIGRFRVSISHCKRSVTCVNMDWTLDSGLLTGGLKSGLSSGLWTRLLNGILTPNSASMQRGG